MSDVVIRVENLFKEYKLGVINHGTLTHDLQSWWARVRGKEDPNSLISLHHNADAERDSFLALKDITFEVKAGERIGIIGKNGAGKSTLLKILSKITSPTKGNVKIKGRVGSLLEVGTGFHPELTGRENIYLNGAILGMSRREIDRKIDEIVDFAGVEKHIDTPVKRYSSGMNVRLGFAVAAHLEPEILIVDEVLAVGDAEFQKKALGKMEDVSKGEGRTILFVSHNMDSIKTLCQKGFLLEKGALIDEGDITKVIANYIHRIESDKFDAPIYGGSYNEFPEDKDKPFQLLSARIFDEHGLTKDIFSSNEKVLIEIVCKVNRAEHNTFGYMLLLKSNNDFFLESDSDDFEFNKLQNLPEGLFKVRMTIPAYILGYGDYGVYFSFGPRPAYEHWDIPGIVCQFRINDISRRGNNRNGMISTLLDWNIMQMD